MSYTPTKTVINSRQLAENVLAYILANQTDAILWANGSALKSLKKFTDAIDNRDKPVYPAIFFSDDNDKQDLLGDLRETVYAVTFEVYVQNTQPSVALTQARKYWQAVASLIVNMPKASLIANTGAANCTLGELETGFLRIGANEAQNDFLQTFQIRATYALMASSFA